MQKLQNGKKQHEILWRIMRYSHNSMLDKIFRKNYNDIHFAGKMIDCDGIGKRDIIIKKSMLYLYYVESK